MYVKMVAVSAILLAGCGGSAFSLGTEFVDDAGEAGDVVARVDADDAGTQVVTTDADAGEAATSDAAPEVSMRADAAPDAPVPACTCGDAGASCFYSVDEPASGYGAPYPVTTVALTPSAPTATFTASVMAVPMPYHDSVWYDLDISSFPNGGNMYIQGQVSDAGCTVSEYLIAQCDATPITGSTPYLEGSGNAVGSWTFPSYQFPAGTTVLHFGTEGSWGNPAGSTNTNKVTVLVQPAS